MIEMTLSSRHRIRNSSPGGLRPSTLPLGHGGSPQYFTRGWGRNIFVVKTRGPVVEAAGNLGKYVWRLTFGTFGTLGPFGTFGTLEHLVHPE